MTIDYCEIVGLKESNNLRTCAIHPVCGAAVVENSVMLLKPCVVLNEAGKSTHE